MKKLLFVLPFILTITARAQVARSFENRWCFIGGSIMLFSAKNDKLYCKLFAPHNPQDFKNFYSSQNVNDSSTYNEVSIDSSKAKLFLTTRFLSVNEQKTLFLVYDKLNDSTLFFVGDVYYDISRMKYTNTNCNIDVPACSNYLYKKNDISFITKNKELKTISRKEVFEVFKRFKVILAKRCNRCYEGFPGADFNRVLIAMGYNPFYQRTFNNELIYDTSGFDFIMEQFTGRGDKPKDQELSDYCEAIRTEFFTGKARQ